MEFFEIFGVTSCIKNWNNSQSATESGDSEFDQLGQTLSRWRGLKIAPAVPGVFF